MRFHPALRLLILVLPLACAACGKMPPDSAYLDRGPETLLDVSSEVVNLSVAGPREVTDLGQWIQRDPPTRAELYCAAGDKNCTEAHKILDLDGVPTSLVGSGDNSVTLVYERILARDCNPRYVDDSYNHWNEFYSSYGCSISANMIQHVSDKQEFVSPGLSDNAPATGAVSAYRRAYAPREVQHPNGYTLQDSLVSKAGGQ